MGLQSEPVNTGGNWSRRAVTLASHGASRIEIGFLRHRRVELNAMPSDVFIAFLQRKLTEHGVCKLVPADDSVLEQHARRAITRTLINKALVEIRPQIEVDAAAVELPADLRNQVVAALGVRPEIPWDVAVADIARMAIDGDKVA
jgi:hypothetical protein